MTSRVFFGWYVALAFSVMAFVSTGIRFAIGPFLKPMVADLDLDRGTFSLVIAVGLLVYGAFQPFVGRLIDRLGARTLVVAGALLMGASLVATGYVTRLWHLYLWFGVVSSIGLAATGPVVGSAVLSAWFARRRTTALSVLGSASMAGMTLLVPATMWCVLTFGWRNTYVLFGVASVLLIVPLGLFFVRDTPEALGLTPDGLPAAPTAGAAPPERTDLADASRSLPFWQLSLGLFTCGFSMSLLSAHGVPMLTDHGYHPMLASWTLGVLGGSSAAFGIVLGALSDRFGRRPMLAWLYASRALIFLGLFLIRDQPVVILVVAVLGGVSMAGTVAMSSALTAEIFGRLSVGSVFGTMFLVHQVGGGIGSWVSGALYESTGGYGAAFVVNSALLVLAALLSITINERRLVPQLAPVAGGPVMATPARSALVVIDAQQEYFAPLGKVVLPEGPAAMQRIARALEWARGAGVPIVHIVHESRRPDPKTFAPGSPTLAIHPAAAPASGEPVMTKHLPGSFTGTALEAFLRERGIERLLVSGFMTQMCVDTTARQAAHLGFAVTVLSDACAAMAVKGPDGAVIAADQVHRTHLGSLQGFLADIKPVADL